MVAIILGYDSYKYSSVNEKENATKVENFDDLTALTILNTTSNM